MSDIGHIEDHLYTHESAQGQKDNTISGKERELVTRLFNAPEKESTQGQTKEDSKDLKADKKYNESLKKAKEKLNQPATITELLQIVKNQIDSINDDHPVGENQLSYYESFVDEVRLIIQDNSDGSYAPFFNKVQVSNNKDISNTKETAKEDIENQIKSITNSISNLRTSLQAKKEEEKNKRIEQEDTLIQKNTSIESIFKTMDSAELQNFKNMIEQLQTGKIDVKHLDPLSDISKLLVAVTNSPDRGSAIDTLNVLITRAISTETDVTKKSSRELAHKELQLHLAALKDPNTEISKLAKEFGESLDKDINGLSYDKLLKVASDPKSLETPEAKKSIATLFHRDQSMYDQLLKDFDDSKKKPGVNNIVKAYYKMNTGEAVRDGYDVEFSSDMIIVPEKKETATPALTKPGFKFKKTNGDEYLKHEGLNLMVYFGELGTGKAETFEQMLGSPGYPRAKELYKIGTDGKFTFSEAPKIQAMMQKQTFKNFGEALTAFFNNPIFVELKRMFSMISLMMTDTSTENGKKAARELELTIGLSDIVQSIGKGGTFEKKIFDTKGNDTGKTETYSWTADKELSDYVNTYKFNHDTDEKEVFVGCNSIYLQIEYMKAKREENNVIVTQTLGKMRDKINASQTNTSTEKPGGESTEQPKPTELVENKATVPQLKINNSSQGVVERKGQGDNQYLTVDGQVVPLNAGEGNIKIGEVFVKMEGEKVQKKTITLSADSKSLTVADGGGPLDIGNGTSPYKDVLSNGKFSYDKIKDNIAGSKDMFHYLAFSLEGNTQLKVMYDAVETDPTNFPKFQEALVKIQSGVMKLSDTDRNADKISGIIGTTLDHAVPADVQKNTKFNDAFADWKKMFGISEKKS